MWTRAGNFFLGWFFLSAATTIAIVGAYGIWWAVAESWRLLWVWWGGELIVSWEIKLWLSVFVVCGILAAVMERMGAFDDGRTRKRRDK